MLAMQNSNTNKLGSNEHKLEERKGGKEKQRSFTHTKKNQTIIGMIHTAKQHHWAPSTTEVYSKMRQQENEKEKKKKQ